MQLVVATYERFLLGYGLPDELQEDCVLKRSFTYAAHQGPVRCVAAGGSWVVSGGQDDQLHIYDAQHGKDLGFMMNPGDGAIPCLQFFTPQGKSVPSHLFSGSDDGSIAIWAAGGGWQHLKLMRGHKGPAEDGHLLLTGQDDGTLLLWDTRCSSQQPSAQLTKAHHGRIRALIAVSPGQLPAGGGRGGLPQHIASASSDGVVKLWDVRHFGNSGGGGGVGGPGSAAASGAVELAQVETKGRKAKEYIEIGTVESLGKLGRSEEQLITYRSFMDKDFPYNFELDVQHWLLWSTEPLNAEAIWDQIDSRFPETEWERLMFVNPAALQSILSHHRLGSLTVDSQV
eukprot:gene9400-9564_t